VKFLLPVDGSSSSRRAESYLTELLDPQDDSIEVLCVVEAVPIGEIDETETGSSIQNRITDEADIVLDETVSRLREEGFDVTSEVEHGDAGEIICQHAKVQNMDGIVMGRRGRGQVEELLLGSVSKYVIHHAEVPVITVPLKL
jgi:nucleotide-binding universal stress UspA family protein